MKKIPMKALNFRYAFLLAAFLLINCLNHAFSQQLLFSSEKYISNGDTLNYRQLNPDNDLLRKYPLSIFPHGSGERGSDNQAQLKWGVMNFAFDQNMIKHPAYIIAPQWLYAIS